MKIISTVMSAGLTIKRAKADQRGKGMNNFKPNGSSGVTRSTGLEPQDFDDANFLAENAMLRSLADQRKEVVASKGLVSFD